MSSVQSYIKQQNILYGALPSEGAGPSNLNTFTPDFSANPNSVIGQFTVIAAPTNAVDQGGNFTGIFRDMGQVIVSANRTFRRVQMLTDSPSTFGVNGDATAASSTTSGPYNTYWYEVSLYNGQGIINSLFQIRG
jgi:hypothetical protein